MSSCIALIELGRKALGEIIEDVFARRHVDRQIGPFRDGDFGEAAFHQAFARRDQLHDGGVALLQIGRDGLDQRRRLHRGDEVIEEALLVALEGAAGGGFRLTVERRRLAGDVRGFKRRFQIVVNDLEGSGIGVVDADLVRASAHVRRSRPRCPRKKATARYRGRASSGRAPALPWRRCRPPRRPRRNRRGWRTENRRCPTGRGAARRQDSARPVAPVAET